jgi:hypothetical protein
MSTLLTGQLLPKISIPDRLRIKAPSLNNLNDRNQQPDCKMKVKDSNHHSPVQEEAPLGEPDPALSLIALTQTIPGVPDQAPASYHVSVTSYAVI